MTIREYIDDFYCKYNENLRVWRLEKELKKMVDTTGNKGLTTEIKAMVKDALMDGLDEGIKFITLKSNPQKLEDAIATASRLNRVRREGKIKAKEWTVDEDGDVEIDMNDLAKEIASFKNYC